MPRRKQKQGERRLAEGRRRHAAPRQLRYRSQRQLNLRVESRAQGWRAKSTVFVVLGLRLRGAWSPARQVGFVAIAGGRSRRGVQCCVHEIAVFTDRVRLRRGMPEAPEQAEHVDAQGQPHGQGTSATGRQLEGGLHRAVAARGCAAHGACFVARFPVKQGMPARLGIR